MSNRFVAIFKNIGFILTLFFGLISCEKDFEDIAVDLVNNNVFSVGDSIINIIGYNMNVDSNRVDNNDVNRQPLYLLGVNQNSDFGYLKSTIISQLAIPSTGVDFGENPIIDLVVLDIPYFATKDGNKDAVDPVTGEVINKEDGSPLRVPNYEIDSIYGNKTQAFQVTVNELGTFLNALDPEDPTKRKAYYSNKNYQLKDELFSGDFLPNKNDTVLYVERKFLDNDFSTVDDVDTIKGTNAIPSMKFVLNSEFFKTRFVEHNNSGDFQSFDNFVKYFRGLHVDANGVDGSLINVAASNAQMTIYYTNDVIEDEGADEDLNGNGTNGEQDVAVRTKQTMSFNFFGVRTGKYVRDYAGSNVENALANTDKINGESKLYVQGAAGSQAILEIFNEDMITSIRNKNWLINEANITVYIDGSQSEVPQKLFLHKYEENSFLLDYLISPQIFGGDLEYDSEGNPEKYKFRITSYVSRVLSDELQEKPSKLVLKNYHTTDIPLAITDTTATNYGWIPKGVVLKGNLPLADEKRIQLELYYSKIND